MNRSKEKKSIRQIILSKRTSLSTEERKKKSEQAADMLDSFPLLSYQKTIFLFYPYRDEIDTRPFMELAKKRGQEIWLPLTLPDERQIIPYLYHDESTLRRGPYDIYEPDPERSQKADLSKLDAIIMPGVAFDLHGGRLGYGGGYYDRFLPTLNRKPLLIGLSFGVQIVDEVPRESHDQLLDYLVTEQGVYGPFRQN